MAKKCKMNVSPDIKKVVFELLSNCNLNCWYCLYRGKKHIKGNLSLEQIYHKINTFKENGIDKLVLTGGEPTLHPDFIDIAKYAIARIPKVSVCTNGNILQDALEQQVIDLEFSAYTVSVDSHNWKVHDQIRGKDGAFEQMKQFLNKLRARDKHISLHITLHMDNIDHIQETINFCRQYSNDLVVSTIYHENSDTATMSDKEYYTRKTDEILLAYANSDVISLVGFGMSCADEDCPDNKYVFMVNQFGEPVGCYWKSLSQV